MSKKKRNRQGGLELTNVHPKTEAQESVFQAYAEDDMNIIMTGCAGTGKTFLAMYLALEDILLTNSPRKTIKLFRSSVPTRDMGFLPGNMNEKLAVYEVPYVSMANELFRCGTAYASLKAQNRIEFISTSYNRGITINDAVIIVDEAQNMTDHEISTILTRMGQDSRIIFCGDSYQVDLNTHRETSGFGTMIKLAEIMEDDFAVIRFGVDDIVRNDMIKRYLKARIQLGV